MKNENLVNDNNQEENTGAAPRTYGWDDVITYDYPGEGDDQGDAQGEPPAATPAAPVGTLTDETPDASEADYLEAVAQNLGEVEEDDRRDPEHEPARLTADAWTAGDFYAVTISADPGDAAKARKMTVKGYDDYTEAREYIHEQGYYITGEDFQTKAQYFPGFLTYEDAVKEFTTADDRFLELKSFPNFSKAAKIRIHDSVVLAADTGAGKSSLAINFLNDLNDEYPVLYFNLEMDGLTILQRLVAIRTGIELDRIEDYQKDMTTQAAVNSALRAITSRKPLQVLKDVYCLEEMEAVIKRTTEDREAPTIVIVDHSLLVTTEARVNGRYERFTHISEELRRISRLYNIVLFVLLQQSRAGKEDEDEEPKNSSLKESGSWENDATKIVFLWYDPSAKRKKLIITKNRSGDGGSFPLEYTKHTQTYREAPGIVTDYEAAHSRQLDADGKQTQRNKDRERLEAAILKAIATAGTKPTLRQVADADGALTSEKIRKWAKEYGGYNIIQTGDKASPEDLIEHAPTQLTQAEANAAGNPWTDEEPDIIG